VACHDKEHQLWRQSDHAKAMAIADKLNVVADFNDQSLINVEQKVLFFIENNTFKATISEKNSTTTYPIKYTFGHYPLQQYLVETMPGKLQVLPFSWDDRPKSEGGQKWFQNHTAENLASNNRLHWLQPMQNWNGMCADCHSDGLVRNYDSKNNTFDTQWQSINVGCLSCHGDRADHIEQRLTKSRPKNSGKPLGHWLRKSSQKTAHWQGVKRNNQFMDDCFACHALRSPLSDGFTAGQHFLDQFSPRLLGAPMYHADGQIKDEVYVYGSFKQSKMFSAGVNCLDCHEKHTMKVKLSGNALCLQCHSPSHYDAKQHHQHKAQSSGALCVNCHMPKNRYMGVDDRRDHSFKIPRPDISKQFNTPNTCIGCHSKQNNEWAIQVLTKWHGVAKPISNNRRHYYRLHSGEKITIEQHLAIVNDALLDVLTRATALELLIQTTSELSSSQLLPYLSHKEDLLRLAAARVSILLPMEQRVKVVTKLLQDKRKAIRLAAARALIDTQVTLQGMAMLKQTVSALVQVNELNSWSGEGRLNKAIVEQAMGQLKEAEQSYIQAIRIDPYFAAGYINLSEFYRLNRQQKKVGLVLNDGMEKLKSSAELYYANALHLTRQRQREQATVFFEKAMMLSPANQQYVYTYVLSLDGEGKTTLAIQQLRQLIVRYSDAQQLMFLGKYLAEKVGDKKAYKWFADYD
jgi:tetratricopeptide (TPR) repeat protein